MVGTTNLCRFLKRRLKLCGLFRKSPAAGDYILQPGPDVCYGADQFTCGVLEFNLKCSKDGGCQCRFLLLARVLVELDTVEVTQCIFYQVARGVAFGFELR